MKSRARSRFNGIVLAAALALPVAGAQASVIQYNFDCTIQNTNPATCTPGGSFGTLTLSDSLVDPNRVDVTVVVNAPGITGLDTFYLNYNNAVTVGGATNRTFGLVSQSALTGDHTSAGNVNINLNTLGPFNTTLDISVDPNSNPGLTFAGSLVVFSTLSGHAESNLDANMFDLKDANGLLYAAYNTLPANQNQQYGALTRAVTPAAVNGVPEPATAVLLGMGLAGFGFSRRRK